MQMPIRLVDGVAIECAGWDDHLDAAGRWVCSTSKPLTVAINLGRLSSIHHLARNYVRSSQVKRTAVISRREGRVVSWHGATCHKTPQTFFDEHDTLQSRR